MASPRAARLGLLSLCAATPTTASESSGLRGGGGRALTALDLAFTVAGTPASGLSQQAAPAPTVEPAAASTEPIAQATPAPTQGPTGLPAPSPTVESTAQPTPSPIAEPTAQPTPVPTSPDELAPAPRCGRWSAEDISGGRVVASLLPEEAPDGIGWFWQQCAWRCALSEVCEFWRVWQERQEDGIVVAGDSPCELLVDGDTHPDPDADAAGGHFGGSWSGPRDEHCRQACVEGDFRLEHDWTFEGSVQGELFDSGFIFSWWHGGFRLLAHVAPNGTLLHKGAIADEGPSWRDPSRWNPTLIEFSFHNFRLCKEPYVTGPSGLQWRTQDDTRCLSSNQGPRLHRRDAAFRACVALGPACLGVSDRRSWGYNHPDHLGEFTLCKSWDGFEESDIRSMVYHKPADAVQPAGPFAEVCDNCTCYDWHSKGTVDRGIVASAAECQAICENSVDCEFATFHATKPFPWSREVGECYTCGGDRHDRAYDFSTTSGGVTYVRVHGPTPRYPCSNGESWEINIIRTQFGDMVACSADVQGHHIAEAPGCEPGFRVCDGIDVYNVHRVQYANAADASQLPGCYAYDSNQDFDSCFSQCGQSHEFINLKFFPVSVSGSTDPDLAGMGAHCSRNEPHREGCSRNGRVGTGNHGCTITRSDIDGVMCCREYYR